MAKTETTVRGYVYTVTSPNGGTVTDAEGKLNKSVDAGDQVTVTAPSDSLTCDDDDAVICKANFKGALAALSLLGGGDKLPAGYTRVEFLASTGTQYIDTGIPLNSESDVSTKAYATREGGGYLFGSMDIVERRRLLALGSQNLQQTVFSGYADTFRYTYGINTFSPHEYRFNGRTLTVDGETVVNYGEVPYFESTTPCYLFAYNRLEVGPDGRGWLRILGVKIAGQAHFVPALDPSGTPCMFDTVSKQPFKNEGTGQFIAGFTLAQAAQLGRKLPSTGGTLTVSLPEGYDMDERVVNSLAEAESKGWVLTIQTYAAETAAATFALRRVWVRRVQDANGGYVSADGTRWQVDWCVDVIGADPESLGYERFRSVDAATEYLGLTPYVDPNSLDEAMGDNGTLEQGDTENTSPETNA